jgi:hypothetical protein
VAICYSAGARKPASHSTETEHLYCDCRRDPDTPSKNRNSNTLAEKRGNQHHNNLQVISYPAYPSLRNTTGTLGEKNPKNLKTPTKSA